MDVMLVFDAVVALFGAYMIGSALHMKKSGRINSMVLAQEELKKHVNFLSNKPIKSRE